MFWSVVCFVCLLLLTLVVLILFICESCWLHWSRVWLLLLSYSEFYCLCIWCLYVSHFHLRALLHSPTPFSFICYPSYVWCGGCCFSFSFSYALSIFPLFIIVSVYVIFGLVCSAYVSFSLFCDTLFVFSNPFLPDFFLLILCFFFTVFVSSPAFSHTFNPTVVSFVSITHAFCLVSFTLCLAPTSTFFSSTTLF